MLGQRSPIDPTAEFAATIGALASRISELERLASVGHGHDPPVMAAWSPTVNQGGTVAGTVGRGWYLARADGTFEATMYWTATGAGAGAGTNPITFSLPVTLSNALDLNGAFIFYDASTTISYAGTAYSNTTTTGALQVNYNGGQLGVNPSIAIAAGDVIRMTIHGRN